MQTRSKAKGNLATDLSWNTAMPFEDSAEGAPGAHVNQQDSAASAQLGASIGNKELSVLVSSIAALSEAVKELRQETARSQQEVCQLRTRVEAEGTSSNQRYSSAVVTEAPQFPLPPLSASPSTSQSLPNSQNGALLPFSDDFRGKLYPLPPFDGNAEDWPLFLANFNDTTREFNYSNQQNLMRLHKALHGEAKRAVTSLLIYPNDVPNVIAELQFNFGRPDLLVRSQLEKVQQFQAISENRLENIIAFSNRIRNIVAFFISAKCQHHLANPTLLEQLVTKLPPSKQYEWSRHAATVTPYPTVEDFAKWISDLARVVTFMPINTTRSYPAPHPQNRHGFTNVRNSQQPATASTVKRVMHNNQVESEQPKFLCTQCKQNHKMSECPAFASLNIAEKWSLVKRDRLCFACLGKGHGVTSCRKRKSCGINGCTRVHHHLLHEESSPSPAAGHGTEHVLNCRQVKCSLIFKILPVELSGPKGNMVVYAMIDEGSSVSLLEEHVADALGLRGHAMPLTLQWFGDTKVTERSKKVAVDIRGCCDKSLEYNINNLRTVKSLNLPRQSFYKNTHEHLKALPIADYKEAKPVLLLGLDNCFLAASKQVVEAGPDEPVASFTRLGWVAFGPRSAQADGTQRVFHIRDASLHKLVADYFEVDSFGVRGAAVLESDEDSRARQILVETTVQKGRYYETGLLWRKDDTVLPSSFSMAITRLTNLEKKMSKNPCFAKRYKAEIDGYIKKGYAELVSTERAACEGTATWYLPHFGVVNVHKPERVRVVFDAAAATSNVSLNSALLKGPEQAKPLIAIIHKFRQGVVAVAGDIREMFSQVRIKAADQDSQRFLWREDTSQPVRVYAMSSMIFGAVCSPCCAEFVKNLNASKHATKMPRGAKVTIDNMYVDDLVVSFNSEQEAEEVTMEAITINKAASFELRRFVSNCKPLQSKLNNEDPAKEIVNMERQGTDKILGMYWNAASDSFEFQYKFQKIPPDVLECRRAPTKRETLAIVMSIFDPFGFLANFTIFTKLLLQSTWKSQITWDEPLPHALCEQWNMWWKEFQRISSFAIPRCYSPILPKADDVQLHIFADASSAAYAAVAYLRVRKGSRVDVAFVMGKTRCAPPKGMTIPRLELQATVLASRIDTSIKSCHDFHIDKTIFWSDSKTVVLWIRSTSRDYKQFVACRIAEIMDTTTPEQWRWLPTDLNVADDATRAKMPPVFATPSRWTTGPEFLQSSEEHWPQEVQPFESQHCILEEKPRLFLVTQSPGENFFINFTKFSSYLKMKRVVAWVLRFAHNARKKNATQQTGELTAKELLSAEILICRQVQREAFASDITALDSEECVSKSSDIYALTPCLDEGLIRVKGRLDNALCLPISARRPIILPNKHHVARLIMQNYHREAHHQNDHIIINTMRQKFWVPHARTLLKSVKRECPVCIQQNAKPKPPLMGQLPADRLQPFVRPFSYTGVDYCGPFHVAIGRRREKRWIALFTCLTTRALHLEVAEDLSTDAFIICLRNFVNRRGMPVRMRSDNGTNFIGAQKALNNESRLFDFGQIQRHMAKNNIEWVFNCPANPSAGGCWERLVQCVKRLLRRTIKEEAPRLETFRSVIIEAENIINSRPLTDLPISVEDEEPLTPNHFLLGCLNSTQTPSLEEEKTCSRKQWRIAQNLKDRLWRRWTVEYLPQLLLRTKWKEEATPLKPGQLVIICDPNQPRGQWRKGLIIEVYAAKDRQVRSALVRTAQGDIRRPASKLAALTFGESQQESTRGGMLARHGNPQ